MVLKNTKSCYLCHGKASNGIDIYGPKGVKLLVASILSKHFGCQLTEVDGSSRTVCRKCWRITDEFHKLYCRVADYILQPNSKLESKPIVCTNSLSNLDIKNENQFGMEQDDSSSNASPENLEPFVKVEDFLDRKTDANIADIDKDMVIDQTEDTQDVPIPIDKEQVRVETDDEKIGKSLPEQTLNTDRPKVSGKQRVQKKKRVRTKDEKIDHQTQLELEDDEIRNGVGIYCDLCERKETSFIDLRHHFRAVHLINGYIKCCNKKFYRRAKLLTHLRDHNFPDKYKCEPCNKTYTNKDSLVRHNRIHDPAFKSIQCPHCPRRFEKQQLLDNHVFERHSNSPKLFECDICKKIYVSKDVISHHILSVHADRYSKFCDLCGRLFKSQSLLKHHYAVMHMGLQTPKIQCTICGEWANKRNFRHHAARHQELGATCGICGKKSSNRVALRKHIRYMHRGKAYNCNFCDKSFKARITLKEHIASHTGFSMYTCSYCPMEFKSGANMYKHRKKNHPDEWMEDQRRRMEQRYKSN